MLAVFGASGLLAAFLFTVAAPATEERRTTKGSVTIYLVRERWHTGIVVPFPLARRCIPEVEELPPSAWVDIGWGEADFYQTPGFDLRLALKAILRHNESVLRLAAVPSDLRRYYGRNSWLLPLCLDSLAAARLCAFLQQAVLRDSLGRAIPTSVHAGGWVRFYRARGTYWGLHTCNTWVARALHSAGFPIHWHGIVLAEQLFAIMHQHRCLTAFP
jgi:uncharacterized protein (TIGR02117 family)